MGVLVVIHRYLGVAVGLLMTLWCLTGFVMMYQSFPELTPAERVAGLQPLDLAGCCALGAVPFEPDDGVAGFRIEMLAGKPVLRLTPQDGPSMILDLRAGAAIEPLSKDQVLAVAQAYGAGHAIGGAPRLLAPTVRDQWTVQYARRDQPIHHLAFGDAAGSEIYVAGKTGEVIEDTNGRERLLGYVGAVPHWLYPTLLRENGKLWSKVVIWTSVVGTFLTLTGLYVGISRWLSAPNGRASPFRGLWMWHHMIGLIFGVLTLTWVASGLLSMNPWGLLEGQGSPAPDQYHGRMTWGAVKSFVAAAPELADGRAVLVDSAPVGGWLFARVLDKSGSVLRVDAGARPAPLAGAEVMAALARLQTPPRSFAELRREDSYYYAHHGRVSLPVYRAILGDAAATRLYIDAEGGQVLRVVGTDERQWRWLQSGLHDLDLPGIRQRPVWDAVVLFLLAGVTALCATGFWLSLRRIRRDVTGVAARREKAKPTL